jgi:hypothetical protein
MADYSLEYRKMVGNLGFLENGGKFKILGNGGSFDYWKMGRNL